MNLNKKALRSYGFLFLLLGFALFAVFNTVGAPNLSLLNVELTMSYTGMNHFNAAGDYYPDIWWYHFEGYVTEEIGGARVPVTGYTWIIETQHRRAATVDSLPSDYSKAGAVYADSVSGKYRVSYPMNMVYHNDWVALVTVYCSGSVEYPSGIWTGWADTVYQVVEGQDAVVYSGTGESPDAGEPIPESDPQLRVLNGYVQDWETSNKISGAAVRVTNSSGYASTVTSDASGWYEFEGLKPDKYRLFVAVSGYQDCVIPEVDLRDRDMFNLVLLLSPLGSVAPPQNYDLPSDETGADGNVPVSGFTLESLPFIFSASGLCMIGLSYVGGKKK